MLRLLSVFLIMWLTSNVAHAHFSIDKSRLYFDKANRFQTLTIRNNSEEPIVYIVKVNHVDMTEQGKLVAVADESKVNQSAKKLVRYSPRRGSILPGGSQVLRFTVKKPAGLDSGEFRSQLRIEGGLQNDPNQLSARVAYNLPIIVRHGQTDAEATMHSFSVVNNEKGEPELQFYLTRSGNRSTFGAFSVIDATGQEIGKTKGVSVYEPLEKRIVKILLNQRPTGKLTVHYQELPEFGGDIKVSREFMVIN